VPSRTTALAVLALVAAACSGPPLPPADPDPSASADPAAVADPPPLPVTEPDRARREGAPDAPQEVSITIPMGELPDGTDIVVELREVTADGRRHVVVDTPAGIAEQHVWTDVDHWLWVHPEGRTHVVDAEWIHFPVADIAAAGGALPELVAAAREPLPGPGAIVEGMELAGFEVRRVERVGADEERLHLDGLREPAVLRRRPLPPGTTVEVPDGATSLRELPDALRW
jgi:hypothetical protein